MTAAGICALPGCGEPYCSRQHRQLAYVREKRRQTVAVDGFEGGPLPEATQLPPEAANASSAAPHAGKWPSWCEPSTRFATVRGEKLPLDYTAHSLGDPFARCRDLKALGIGGRIGFHAASGGIGIIVDIDAGARLTVEECGSRSVRLVRWKPFPMGAFPARPNEQVAPFEEVREDFAE